MGAIGLNPIRLDAIGLDPIRFNAIKLGVPGASSATDRPYISPDVLSALAGIWIADGKSNTDPDRNIIKNKLPGRGGDFEIFNAAYEGMSGCNGYPVVFGANKTWEHFSGTANYTSDTTSTTIHITHVRLANRGLLYSYVKENGVLTNIKEIPAFRVTVKGLEGNSKLVYKYLATKDATKETSLHLSNGTHKLPKSFVPTDALLDLTTNSWIGMYISPISEEVTEFDCDITIEILPEYEGAFVTDGVNDMITSTKTVQEMGITDEVTVVSMIHQIDLNSTYTIATTNYIENSNSREHVRSDVYNYGKTGIYGYSASLINNTKSDIKNILGDKADYYVKSTNSLQTIFDAKFSVVGRISELTEASQLAWYWTIIANKVLTTDQINQVIAYYNLDRCVEPTVLYDVKRQGLSNDTPDSDWYLKDYSGNGYDMTLYNYAKTPESGINEDGGLQSDGVVDYGQFVGDLGLKDYTVVIDRAYPIVSERQYTATSDATGENSNTPFLLEHIDAVKDEYAYSYLAATAISINKEREICYQSTYQYKDTVIKKGSSTSLGTGLTIAKYGVNPTYSALALYSFMLFHYSMSKFLIERQLKKRKLGTLYPGMVEFRPIVKSNIPYSSISYSVNPGEYVIEGSTVTITITLSNSSDKLVDISSNAISDISISGDNGVYEVTGKVTKSPQKINIVISSYLTMLDNETLITNETLIKNE